MSERRSRAEEPAGFGVFAEEVYGADETDVTGFENARRSAAESRESLRLEIALLRVRMAYLRQHAEAAIEASKNALRAEVKWIDASAHAQLGQYPWLKLAGAMAVTSIVTRMLRHVTLGAVSAAALALIASQHRRR